MLQRPIIYWAGQPVRSLNIRLRDRQIPAGHIQSAMPKHPLQRMWIAVVTQVLDGKCVPEAVHPTQLLNIRQGCQPAYSAINPYVWTSTDKEDFSVRCLLQTGELCASLSFKARRTRC